jgi:DNA polymerase elongation subunit (family B)
METKAGRVTNYSPELHIKGKISKYKIEMGDVKVELDREQFMSFMLESKYTISSNGILYRTDKKGIIPEVLEVWFAERVRFKKLMKESSLNGDKELMEFYDKRQHVQKILLNSIYGILGLPTTRFYDLDNALAVTSTGQTIIKATGLFINGEYNKSK